MITYQEYAKAFKLEFDAAGLDYSLLADGRYCIFENSAPLFTPAGKMMACQSEDLIRRITTDMQLFSVNGQTGFSALTVFPFSKDVLEEGPDPFVGNWLKNSERDPFVSMKSTGKPASRTPDPDDPLFSFYFITLSDLTGRVNRMSERAISELALEEDEADPFLVILMHLYLELDVYKKAAVQALSSLHQAGIVLPLMVVSGEISCGIYVKGLISLGIQPVEAFGRLMHEVTSVLPEPERFVPGNPEFARISDIIRAGEGDKAEFKSTLRWDIRAGKTNPAIERASLKTIAAFLNTAGGTLLIGVRDDGSIEGIETDKFANEDKFLLHLWTLIRSCMGRDFSPYIRTRIEKTEDRSICVVTCQPASRPAYLRQPGFDEELYIRVGPSSNALDISEAVRYVGDRFVYVP